MITYVLKDPQFKAVVKHPTLIYLTFYYDGCRMKMSTGERIHPNHWNKSKCRARANAPLSASLNAYLDRLEAKVKNIHLQMKSELMPITPNFLRIAIEQDIKYGSKKITFTDFFDELILEKENNNTKDGTLQVYHSALKLLKKFTGSKNFNDIDSNWFKRYQTYLENYRDKKIPDGYGANYIGKNIAIIKEVMTIAKNRKLHRNDNYKNSEYKKPSEEADTIFLTTEELIKIHKANLSPAMEKIKDRFLIGAFTLLRFSDNTTITLDNIQDGLMYDKNKKTGANVVIPIHYIVKEILEKYPDGLPPAISNQKTNKALKIIGEMAGIDTLTIIHKTKGGKVHEIKCPKYKLITTHTARRSAACNMLLAGISKKIIMMLGGWKSDKSFNKYLRVSQLEVALSIKDHAYFQE